MEFRGDGPGGPDRPDQGGRPAVARAVARWTGRPEAQILSLIGAGFLAISLIDFLRQVDAVIAAGRTAPSAGQERSRRPRPGRPAVRRHPAADRGAAGSKGQSPR